MSNDGGQDASGHHCTRVDLLINNLRYLKDTLGRGWTAENRILKARVGIEPA